MQIITVNIKEYNLKLLNIMLMVKIVSMTFNFFSIDYSFNFEKLF